MDLLKAEMQLRLKDFIIAGIDWLLCESFKFHCLHRQKQSKESCFDKLGKRFIVVAFHSGARCALDELNDQLRVF